MSRQYSSVLSSPLLPSSTVTFGAAAAVPPAVVARTASSASQKQKKSSKQQPPQFRDIGIGTSTSDNNFWNCNNPSVPAPSDSKEEEGNQQQQQYSPFTSVSIQCDLDFLSLSDQEKRLRAVVFGESSVVGAYGADDLDDGDAAAAASDARAKSPPRVAGGGGGAGRRRADAFAATHIMSVAFQARQQEAEKAMQRKRDELEKLHKQLLQEQEQLKEGQLGAENEYKQRVSDLEKKLFDREGQLLQFKKRSDTERRGVSERLSMVEKRLSEKSSELTRALNDNVNLNATSKQMQQQIGLLELKLKKAMERAAHAEHQHRASSGSRSGSPLEGEDSSSFNLGAAGSSGRLSRSQSGVGDSSASLAGGSRRGGGALGNQSTASGVRPYAMTTAELNGRKQSMTQQRKQSIRRASQMFGSRASFGGEPEVENEMTRTNSLFGGQLSAIPFIDGDEIIDDDGAMSARSGATAASRARGGGGAGGGGIQDWITKTSSPAKVSRAPVLRSSMRSERSSSKGSPIGSPTTSKTATAAATHRTSRVTIDSPGVTPKNNNNNKQQQQSISQPGTPSSPTIVVSDPAASTAASAPTAPGSPDSSARRRASAVQFDDGEERSSASKNTTPPVPGASPQTPFAPWAGGRAGDTPPAASFTTSVSTTVEVSCQTDDNEATTATTTTESSSSAVAPRPPSPPALAKTARRVSFGGEEASKVSSSSSSSEEQKQQQKQLQDRIAAQEEEIARLRSELSAALASSSSSRKTPTPTPSSPTPDNQPEQQQEEAAADSTTTTPPPQRVEHVTVKVHRNVGNDAVVNSAFVNSIGEQRRSLALAERVLKALTVQVANMHQHSDTSNSAAAASPPSLSLEDLSQTLKAERDAHQQDLERVQASFSQREEQLVQITQLAVRGMDVRKLFAQFCSATPGAPAPSLDFSSATAPLPPQQQQQQQQQPGGVHRPFVQYDRAASPNTTNRSSVSFNLQQHQQQQLMLTPETRSLSPSSLPAADAFGLLADLPRALQEQRNNGSNNSKRPLSARTAGGAAAASAASSKPYRQPRQPQTARPTSAVAAASLNPSGVAASRSKHLHLRMQDRYAQYAQMMGDGGGAVGQ